MQDALVLTYPKVHITEDAFWIEYFELSVFKPIRLEQLVEVSLGCELR